MPGIRLQAKVVPEGPRYKYGKPDGVKASLSYSEADDHEIVFSLGCPAEFDVKLFDHRLTANEKLVSVVLALNGLDRAISLTRALVELGDQLRPVLEQLEREA